MATRVIRSVSVRRPYPDVAEFVSDAGALLPCLQGFARYTQVAIQPDGSELWDMHTDVGSIHVGSRVHVSSPGKGRLSGASLRGIDHTLEFTVTEGAVTTIEVVFTLELPGALFARISEQLARGIAGRHLEAGLQQVRHHLEFEAR